MEGLPGQCRPTLPRERQYVDQDGNVRRWIYGNKDANKLSRTIILVGETGSGKTTLSNCLVNYLQDAKKGDHVWDEISDGSEVNSTISKTECVTVKEVFNEKSSVSWSIIDTPGYGNTRGLENDKNISKWLLHCFAKIALDSLAAIVLVVPATLNRLHDRQLYIFDAIQSLFGNDVKENIVVFVTRANELNCGNALIAIEEANIPVAKRDNKPVYFLYDNIQHSCISEELYSEKWDMGQRSTETFLNILDTLETKSLEKSKDVLNYRHNLDAYVCQLKDCVTSIQKKQSDLENLKKDKESNKDFVYETEEKYYIPENSSCFKIYKVTSCSECKENCHLRCSGIRNPSWCKVMKKGRCTKCIGRCAADKHVTKHRKYVTKTEIKIHEDKQRTYDEMVQCYKAELSIKNAEKSKILERAYDCITYLENNALKCNSFHTPLQLDFLIEVIEKENSKMEMIEKDNSETEMVEKDNAERKRQTDILQNLKQLRRKHDLYEKAVNYLKP